MEKLLEELKNGRSVILPTETVYGLFAKALDQEAVENVYRLKKRPRDKALNLNVATLDQVAQFARDWPVCFEVLTQAFWPGPLTILLPASSQVPYWVNSGLSTVGFRMPAHPITLKLIQEVGPLIGPSANLSGQPSGRFFKQIQADIPVAGFEDDSFLTGVDSTILDLSRKKARMIRQGQISKQDLLTVCPTLVFEEEEK